MFLSGGERASRTATGATALDPGREVPLQMGVLPAAPSMGTKIGMPIDSVMPWERKRLRWV